MSPCRACQGFEGCGSWPHLSPGRTHCPASLNMSSTFHQQTLWCMSPYQAGIYWANLSIYHLKIVRVHPEVEERVGSRRAEGNKWGNYGDKHCCPGKVGRSTWDILGKYEKKNRHLHCAAATAAKSLQSCPTLCNPIDGSSLGSSVPGILQARILEWVAISFSNAWKWKVKVKSLSRALLLATPWTGAYQAPPSMGFSRQEYWSGVPLPLRPTLWFFF